MKQRALLAHLVIARGRPVPAKHLIRALWEDFPPRDPAHALQARVSRLRAAFPAEISLVDGGYRLDPVEVHTDSARFEELCDEGQWLLADGELTDASECLHIALALWQGSAFTGLLDFAVPSAEAARLEKMRVAAVADRIDVDLALGRCVEVIAELHALVEEQPFAERHWGQLMAALYCDNRANEALRVFAGARATFVDGLGVEPSNALGRLHVSILREQPPASLMRLSVSATPGNTSTSGAQSSAPTQPTSLSSNHPDALVELLRSYRTLILTGPAGIGKTHLLRAISAHFEAQHFSATVLGASSLSRQVPLGVFAGSGALISPQWTTPATLIDQFSRHRSKTVLLVDNVGQLDEASLFVVTQLIRTSRIPTILTARSLTDAPPEIQALYDAGDLTEVGVDALTPADAEELAAHMLGGALVPGARSQVFAAAGGNPLHLREIIAASRDEGRLVRTGTTWELHGEPASTPRLTQLVGERFSSLDDAGMEGAAKLAIAGEYPADALGDASRRSLARAGVVEYSTAGWLRLSHPLDAQILGARISTMLWRDLTIEVLDVLLSDVTAGHPVARRRAHILALDLDQPIDAESTISVARHALGTFDERLALRAAQAVVAQDPRNAEGHRLMAEAASALGRFDVAEESFGEAFQTASTDSQHAEVALARARHLGVRLHDAAGALAVIQRAMGWVSDPEELGHLRRDSVRWAVLAGQAGEEVAIPTGGPDVMVAMGLITAGMSGVITGPLDDALFALARLGHVPAETIELVPGGADLVLLTEIMAVSNSGDMAAARYRLEIAIADAELRGAESLGAWEYALGFTELFSGSAERAYGLGVSACTHLEWRDIAGLLPAAGALTAAAAHASGRTALAEEHLDAIPGKADGDPKVVMLRAWKDAWQQNAEGHDALATAILLDTARWLLTAQHNYFAALLAHCAARIGLDVRGAVAVIEEAKSVTGGGLVEIFSRHGGATIAGDAAALDEIAHDARELGMTSTATDTWLSLLRLPGNGETATNRASRQRLAVDELAAQTPAMALWMQTEPGVRAAILG
ncbi:BTAD domain-containing putative transcriptional regulator [Demequina aurantiaca]|uniref:BTAD domain-containing putative transcriptional regulator n=1 Tax=Demequina aurantiaca TaxID=676200 RepID=UPI003D34AB19